MAPGAETCWSLILLKACILLTAFIVQYIDYKNMHGVSNIKFDIVQFVPIYDTKFSLSRFCILSQQDSEESALESNANYLWWFEHKSYFNTSLLLKQPYWYAERTTFGSVPHSNLGWSTGFLLRIPVLLFDQLYKLVLRALFRLSVSTLVNCFPHLQARVSSVDWSRFHNSKGNICPWTTVLNCICIKTSRYLQLLNVFENTSPTMEWRPLVVYSLAER